jgi:hypothetical protein
MAEQPILHGADALIDQRLAVHAVTITAIGRIILRRRRRCERERERGNRHAAGQ